MRYNVNFEICSILFLILILFLTSKKGIKDFQTRLFRIYFNGALLNMCLDVISVYTLEHSDVVPFWVNYILNWVFLLFQFFIPTLLAFYICMMIQSVRELSRRVMVIVFIPALLGAALMVSNPWTNCIFFIDGTGYHHGPLHVYLYINSLIYALGTLGFAVFSRKLLSKKQSLFVCMFVLIAMLPTVVQFFMPNYMLSGMGTAMSIMMMITTNENIMVYEDTMTGAMNRDAFSLHVREAAKKYIPLQIYVLALDNFKLINEMYGMEGGNFLMQQLVGALKREYGSNHVFRLEGDIFAVALEEKTESVREIERIHKILRRKWAVGDTETELSACLGLVHTIHHENRGLLYAIEYAISQGKKRGKGQFFEVDEHAADSMLRRAAIEQAMLGCIERGSFEVHYQPIYDVKHGRFHSMEALARLNVPGYGYVSPEEFILIAEKNGTIIQIGMLVLEEVCRFIKEYDLQEKGIEFVEVNLSVVQCMQEKIHDDIKALLARYEVSPSMINLEITETAAAYSEKRLTRNMARISLLDITFSLDDYGSGYSNVNYLVDLPFSIVKLDKHIVWTAMEKIPSRKILANTISMFRDIHLKIVVEGIENREMMDMVTEMGADYLQGYYFSKPVPKDIAVKCLKEEYLNGIFKKDM